MPVNKDESGRRSVQVEVEVPGTPEQVWQAIGSGPGISSWFVPAEMDGREGGKIVMHFGPGSSMDSVATITEWDPPRRFAAANTQGGLDIATEWIVEARAGGPCLVRVVHSWFANTDDWDKEFESREHGWGSFFQILRLYLAHFPGQSSTPFQVMGATTTAAAAAWQTVLESLGLASAAVGQRVASAPGAPRFAGHVERAGSDRHVELLLRVDDPAPGLVHLLSLAMGGQTYVFVRVFFYGGGSAAAASREEPAWQAWMNSLFPQPAAAAGEAQEA